MGLMDTLNKGAKKFGVEVDKTVQKVKDDLSTPESQEQIKTMKEMPGKVLGKVKKMVTGSDVSEGLAKENK